MKINLSQNEITRAIRQYIRQQGINLEGKNVEVTYTSTRSGAGVVADITVEEQDQIDEPSSVVQEAAPATPATPVSAPKAMAFTDAVEAAPSSFEQLKDDAVAAAAPKTTSLFS